MSAIDDAFVRAHEGLVRRTALGVARQLGMLSLVDDFVSIGFEALIDAHARFDAARGVPFEGFAYYRIRGRMLVDGPRIQGLSRKTLARVMRAGDAAAEQLAGERAERDDSGTADQVALGLDTLFGKLTGAMVCARLAEEERTPESSLMAELDRARVRRAIDALPERERLLLLALYFEERVLDEVAPEIGLTRSGASRMHTRALDLLRHALGPPS